MPRGKPVHFGDIQFNTQRDAQNYVRNLLATIGNCSSVHRSAPKLFEKLHNVLKRHPYASEKLKDMEDLLVKTNEMNTGQEVYVIKRNGFVDISWRICVLGHPKSSLASAMRSSTQAECDAFKNAFLMSPGQVCTVCQVTVLVRSNMHTDHFPVQFATLQDNFIASSEKPIPVDFADVNDGTNRATFLPEDYEWMQDWQHYHQSHATFRVICATCNLKRKRKDE